MKNTLGALSLLTLLVSCGEKSSVYDLPASGSSSVGSQNFQSRTVQSDISRQKFICDRNFKNCNKAMLFLGVKAGTRLNQCAAFFISSDIAMTASSCLPKVKEGKSCKDVLALKDATGRVFECESVFKEESKSEVGFIKVTSATSATPYTVNQDGINEVQSESSVTLNTLASFKRSSDRYPTLTVSLEKRCAPVTNSLLEMSAKNEFSSKVLLSNCKADFRNLGSPILNAAGEVTGIVTGMNRDRSVKGNFAFATNLTCETLPATVNSTNSVNATKDSECAKKSNVQSPSELVEDYLLDASVASNNVDLFDATNTMITDKVSSIRIFEKDGKKKFFLLAKQDVTCVDGATTLEGSTELCELKTKLDKNYKIDKTKLVVDCQGEKVNFKLIKKDNEYNALYFFNSLTYAGYHSSNNPRKIAECK